MSDTAQSARARLRMGLDAANKVDFTGVAEGTETIGSGQAQDVRDVPGARGVLAAQLGNFTDNTFSLTTDANAKHNPVLRGANGKRLFIEWRPLGDGTGKPTLDFEAVATTTRTYDQTTDAQSWDVTLDIDGEPTEAVQVANEDGTGFVAAEPEPDPDPQPPLEAEAEAPAEDNELVSS